MKFITLREDNASAYQKHLNFYLFIIFFALAFGIIISFGALTPLQTLILVCVVFLLFFVFNKPDLICLLTVSLMFLPLSLGTVYHLRITWSAEPLIMILFILVVLRNIHSRLKSFVLTVEGNPFLLPLLLYLLVFVFNYMRHPLPASSMAGIAEEMGGIRFYYDKILMFLFCLSIGYLVEMNNDFTRRFFNVLLLMTALVTTIGILVFLFQPLYEFIEKMRLAGIFTDATILTGLWHKTLDPYTSALRNTILWITPFGLLMLISNVVKVKNFVKVILLFFLMTGLILSATRSFFFGTLFALIVWAFLTRNKKILILLTVVTVIGFLLPTIGLLSRQFDRILYFPTDLDKLSSFRYTLFETYWKVFKQNPLFGVGVGATEVGNYAPASPEYFILQNLRFGGHGFFLGTLYTQGIVGLMPFLLLYFLAIKYGLRFLRSHKTTQHMNIGLFSLMFVAYSFIPFFVGGSETYNQFFVIIGVLAGSIAREHKIREERK